MVLPDPQAVPTFSPTTRYSFLAESKITGLVSTHIDNLANHMGTTVLIFIEGHDLALQRQLVLIDDRCIHVRTGVMVNPALATLSGTSLPDTMPK